MVHFACNWSEGYGKMASMPRNPQHGGPRGLPQQAGTVGHFPKRQPAALDADPPGPPLLPQLAAKGHETKERTILGVEPFSNPVLYFHLANSSLVSEIVFAKNVVTRRTTGCGGKGSNDM
jgi:hypothetical protein